MADEVPDGMCLAGAGRSLYEDSAHGLSVLSDANLFRVGRLAQKNVLRRVEWESGFGIRLRTCEGGLKTYDIQKRPGEIFSTS